MFTGRVREEVIRVIGPKPQGVSIHLSTAQYDFQTSDSSLDRPRLEFVLGQLWFNRDLGYLDR